MIYLFNKLKLKEIIIDILASISPKFDYLNTYLTTIYHEQFSKDNYSK